MEVIIGNGFDVYKEEVYKVVKRNVEEVCNGSNGDVRNSKIT